jgi:hypothetical protein
MHNWFAIETEAEAMRLERERAAAAEARTAQAVRTGRSTRWPHVPHLSLALLRSLTMPRMNAATSSCTPRPVQS